VSSFRFHPADRAVRERRESAQHASAGYSSSFHNSGKTEATWAAGARERPSRPVGCGPYLCTESARFVLRPGICSGAGPLIPNGTLETLRRRPPGGKIGRASCRERVEEAGGE